MIREMGSLIGHYKMKRTLLLIIIGILISSFFSVSVENVSADSTSYYVANDGNDSNSGTSIGSPWKTIGKVNSEFGNAIRPGDDIYFNRGDTFSDTYLNVGVSGEGISNPTVIGAYGSGDKPKIQGTGAYGILISSKDYITIQNIAIENTNDWVGLRDGNCDYITIQGCTMNNGNDWGGILANGGGSYIRVIDNTLSDCIGDVLEFHGGGGTWSHCLIEGNTITGGASNDHSCLAIRSGCEYFIIRNNTLYDGDDDLAQFLYVTRYNLFENNTLNGIATNGAGLKFQGGHGNIIRNNVVYGTGAFGFGAYISSVTPTDIHDNMWYHNTVYGTGDGGTVDYDGGLVFAYYNGANKIRDNVIKNNIFHTPNRYGFAISSTGSPSDIYNNVYDNNVIYNPSSNYVRYFGTAYTLPGIQSAYPTAFMNNMNSNPQLESDYTLSSTSPCIDAGTWLTYTANSGAGTSIQVDNAHYFCDGFGLIDGDDIVIGTEKVTIINVNYNNNQITVDNSITWSNGDPVSLSYYGNAPDIGAYESSFSGLDTTPPQITSINIIESDPLDTDASFGWIDIIATVTDNSEVNTVMININCPNGSIINASMNDIGSNTYHYYTTTTFSNHGNYDYNIWAIDTSGNPSTSNVYDFAMPPNWDIDMNGVCNILDLTLISNNYGEQGQNGWLREDIDNNGIIQVLDLAMISAHYYETW
jgi:hypothetical protein